jgi:hypothetical protein
VARTDRDERAEFKDDNSPYLAQIKEILRNHLWINWNIGMICYVVDSIVYFLVTYAQVIFKE